MYKFKDMINIFLLDQTTASFKQIQIMRNSTWKSSKRNLIDY